MSFIDQTKDIIRALPERKRYLEFLTAALSVPVLVTVIYSNVTAIKNGQKEPSPTPQVASVTKPSPIVIEVKQSPTILANTTNPKPTQTVECKKEVGPVTIVSPKADETFTELPIFIDLNYDQGDFCSVVWSYRLNEGHWSEFTSNAISLYDLSPGDKRLQIRVRSIASQDEKVLETMFSYNPPQPVQPIASPQASPSASEST